MCKFMSQTMKITFEIILNKPFSLRAGTSTLLYPISPSSGFRSLEIQILIQSSSGGLLLAMFLKGNAICYDMIQYFSKDFKTNEMQY